MKSVFKFSTVFLILGLCWINIIGNSQDLKLNKKEQKEARKAERLKDYEALGALLESRKFAFVTDRAQGTTGATVYNVVQVAEARVFARCEDPKNTFGGFSGAADNTSPRIGPTGIFYEITIIINPNKSAGIEIRSRVGHIVYSNYTGRIRT
jgi:hypothetical protein